MSIDQESFTILLDTLQRYVRERLTPLEDYIEENDQIPNEVIEEMKEMGLFGISIPEEYGGIGLSLSQECEVNYVVCQTSLAFRSAFGTNVGIGSQGILMDGTETQKQYYLPRVATGELIMAFALTEPEAGSDAQALKTYGKLNGDHYVLNGTKRFITNAPRAGAFTLMVRTSHEPRNNISAFIVPTDLPGITLGKPDQKMGQRGTQTCDVILEDVLVPAENIIGGIPGKGFKTAMKVLDRGRIHLAAVACGLAQRILDESVAYAKERKQFGQPIGEFQLIQAMLADSQAELLAAWALVRESAKMYDEHHTPGEKNPDISLRASCAKMYATEMLGRVADRGVQIHGGSGYMRDYKVERFYRDARLLRLYEGTTQIQQIIIGRTLVREK